MNQMVEAQALFREQAERSEKLRRVYQDSLTGLANRASRCSWCPGQQPGGGPRRLPAAVAGQDLAGLNARLGGQRGSVAAGGGEQLRRACAVTRKPMT
jgi:hypothetical protein